MLTTILLFIVGLEVNSKVDSVVVYADRVLVSRIAYVALEKSTDLVFAGLPGSFDDQSVRIKAKDLTIGEIQVKRGYLKEPHPKVKDLEAKIKALEIEDRNLSDELLVIRESEKFLSSIAVGSADIIIKEINTAKISPQSWQQGLNFIVDKWVGAKTRIAGIERRQVELKDRLDALRNELNDVRADVEQRKAVVFDVHPKNPQTYRIELTYILPGASWRTYYEVRGSPSDKAIELSYYGKIFQRTGEDWEDTKVVLSTGVPAMGGTAPVPEPWYIRFYEYGYRGDRPEEEARTAEAKAAPAPSKKEAVFLAPPPAPPVEAGIAIWYPLPGRYAIKSGDQERKVLIKKGSFDAEFEYFTLPRVAQLAYLTGKMKNNTDYLFIAGEGNTYVGDDFTGRIYFPTVSPDESTEVSLGMDERIKVTREAKKMNVKKGGLFGGKTRYEFTYENVVENYHTKEIKCRIVDQIPLPGDPDIKVSDVKLDPKPTEEDKDRGLSYWQVRICAKGKYKINVSFVVEAPADKQIEGLMP